MSPKFRIGILHFPKIESTVITYFRFYFTPNDIEALEKRGVIDNGPKPRDTLRDYCLKSLVRRRYIYTANIRYVPFDSYTEYKDGDITVFEFNDTRNDSLDNQFYKAKDVEEENTDYYDPNEKKDPRKWNAIYYANCLLANAPY